MAERVRLLVNARTKRSFCPRGDTVVTTHLPCDCPAHRWLNSQPALPVCTYEFNKAGVCGVLNFAVFCG